MPSRFGENLIYLFVVAVTSSPQVTPIWRTKVPPDWDFNMMGMQSSLNSISHASRMEAPARHALPILHDTPSTLSGSQRSDLHYESFRPAHAAISTMSSPSFSFYTPTAPSTTCLFTPCRLSPTSLPSFSYIPQTPSPLRTSHNANLMAPPPTPTATMKSSPLASTENVWNSASTDENTFNFSPTISTPNPSSKETKFSRRARSQSPVTELGSRTSAARDRRKSLFLEQIRTRREDEKFETRGDQVLRMDWAREEAERKARLARQAQRLTQLQTELDEDDVMLDESEQGPSPTEERELEELIRLHEESQGQGEPVEEDMMDDLDDEDYDQLFMEVINASQRQQADPVSQHQQQDLRSSAWPQQDLPFASDPADGSGNLEQSMDIS